MAGVFQWRFLTAAICNSTYIYLGKFNFVVFFFFWNETSFCNWSSNILSSNILVQSEETIPFQTNVNPTFTVTFSLSCSKHPEWLLLFINVQRKTK